MLASLQSGDRDWSQEAICGAHSDNVHFRIADGFLPMNGVTGTMTIRHLRGAACIDICDNN
jgi:hypothetical protein